MEHRFIIRLNGKKNYGYGMVHSDFPLFDSVWIKNETEYAFSNLHLSIRTNPNVLLQGDLTLDFIHPNGYKALSCEEVRLDLSLLASLTKVLPVTVSLEILTEDGRLLDRHERSIRLMPYNTFSGLGDMPESIAMLVTPEQKEVSRIAASLPKDSLYDFCQAAYDLIKLRKINFVSEDYSDQSFKPVRLAENVLADNRANATELALFFASLAESAGYSPCLFFAGKGKTYVGVRSGGRKRSLLTASAAEEMHLPDYFIVDGAYFAYGSELNFDGALQQSKNSLSFYDGKTLKVDIDAARRMHILPLPNRVEENGSFILSEETAEQGATFSGYMEAVKRFADHPRILSLLTANHLPVTVRKDKFFFRPELDVNQNKILQKILCDDFTLIRAQHGTGMTTVFATAAAAALKAGKRVLYLTEEQYDPDAFAEKTADFFDPAFVLDLTRDEKHAVDADFKGLFEEHDGIYEQSEAQNRAFREMDRYYETLEGGKSIVRSFYIAAEQFLQLRDAADTIVFAPEQIGMLSDEMVQTWFSTVSEIDLTLNETGPIDAHPLQLIRCQNFSYEYKSKLIRELEEITQLLDRLVTLRDQVKLRFEEPLDLTTRGELDAFMELIRLCTAETALPVDFFRDHLEIEENFRRITKLLQAKKENDGIGASVFLSFEKSILELDAAALLSQWREAAGDKGFRSMSRHRNLSKTVKRYLKPNFDVENVEFILSKLSLYQTNDALIQKERESLFALLGAEGEDEAAWEGFSLINDLCYQVYNVFLAAFERPLIHSVLTDLAAALSADDAADTVLNFRSEYNRFRRKKNELSQTISQGLDHAFGENFLGEGDYLSDLSAYLSFVTGQIDGLHAWCDWLNISARAERIGLKNLTAAIESGRVNATDLKKTFLRAFFKGVCEYNFMVSPDLAPGQFDFAQRKETIRDVQKALPGERKRELDSLLSVNKLDALSKLPQGTDALELLRTDPDRFRAIFPCVISDFSTAKKIFEERDGFFDLILVENRRSFPIRDFLWVLSAGRNVAFAGDFTMERKRPVQNFDLAHPAFDTLWKAIEDHNNASAVYGADGAMVTLVSTASSAWRTDFRCYGVPQAAPADPAEWVNVGGFFHTEVAKANLQEAQYVVERLVRFCMDQREHSLSVICATAAQKDLILQLFAQKMRHQGDLAQRLSEPGKSLFISAVGEELRPADQVIFTCTFAPDRSVPGQHMPFEFLYFGRPDVKRILLDILSSAKKHLTVVASFGIEELDRLSTVFPVAEAFSLLFDLCHGEALNNGYALNREQSPANAILRLDKILREKGYQTVLGVQNGRFFVDLAVEQEGRFTLGILSDHTVMNQKANISAIEFANLHLFEENGWQIFRLHSSDAVDNLEREAEKVCKLLGAEKESTTILA